MRAPRHRSPPSTSADAHLTRPAPAIAIVGTRRPTAAGVHAAKTIATDLALAGYTIVSGLAVGIDAVAHRAALDAGGITIAVLGCGHDIDYPKRNGPLRRQIETEGTVLSEYTPEVQPQPFFFPQRNRIIAGLSIATVVIEGTIRSGALVTARLALDANREVFAVPGSVRNVMAEGPERVDPSRRSRARDRRSSGGRRSGRSASSVRTRTPSSDRAHARSRELVLAHLDDVPDTIDGFIKATGLSASEVTGALGLLELDRFAEAVDPRLRDHKRRCIASSEGQ